MFKFAKGMVTGVAMGAVAAAAVMTSMDPKLSRRLARRGQCMVKKAKRQIAGFKDMAFQ